MEVDIMEIEIGFLVFEKFQLLDLSGPLAAFEFASKHINRHFYRLRVLSIDGGPIKSSSGVVVFTESAYEAQLDTLIIVGGDFPYNPERAMQIASTVCLIAPTTRRVTSICTGAFVLAEAGLLNARAATTHWRYSPALQSRYPKIKVDSNRIYTRDGPYWTSAGITAGIDLALALVENDLGHEIASSTARDLVVCYRRSGGQSQFSTMLELDPESDRIRLTLNYAREHLNEKLSVEKLAEIACISPRQFTRCFVAATGETPAKAVERLRAEAARLLIETSIDPIEQIAKKVGFVDPERMRRAFLRLYGQPPQGVRRSIATLPHAASVI
jgi:transcriptional regulator GlxA family with amidase domain